MMRGFVTCPLIAFKPIGNRDVQSTAPLEPLVQQNGCRSCSALQGGICRGLADTRNTKTVGRVIGKVNDKFM